MTTPPRKATSLPELAGTRSPGTTMPTRFIGSAAETGIVSPDGCSWRMARKDSTATGNANCSPKKPLTNRPPLTSPRSSSRLRIISSSRHFGRIDSQARSRSEEHTSELQSHSDLVCRLLLEKKKKKKKKKTTRIIEKKQANILQ